MCIGAFEQISFCPHGMCVCVCVCVFVRTSTGNFSMRVQGRLLGVGGLRGREREGDKRRNTQKINKKENVECECVITSIDSCYLEKLIIVELSRISCTLRNWSDDYYVYTSRH